MNSQLELVAVSGYLPSAGVGISSAFRLGAYTLFTVSETTIASSFSDPARSKPVLTLGNSPKLTFSEAQQRMKDYPQAFALRGAGLGAVAPDRFSTTNTPGLVKSYLVGNSLRIL